MNAPEQPRILVVDDDPGLLRLISKALRREGFEVATARSDIEANTRLMEGTCALLMVDLRLEETTGQALLEGLAARNIHIPFVVITGQGDERVAVDLMRKGALDYLVKDAEFLESMPTRIRRAIDSVQQKARLVEAEAALKREHAFLSAILNTAGAVVIVLDSEERVVRFNRAAEEVTGYSAEEVLGADFAEKLVPDDDRVACREVLDRIWSGERRIQRQGKLLTKSGEVRLIAWSSTRIAEEGGDPVFVIRTGIDITERRRLEEQILEISGREQRRIGQDLHDGLGQYLTGIELMTQCLQQSLASKKRAEATQAANISKHVREAIRQSKALARGLSPVELDRHGLMSALQELASGTAEICRINCTFECRSPIHLEDNQRATHLYRIAQEAVNNAVKHGRANHIRIRLTGNSAERATLTIQDDGSGFEPNATSRGMGLGIMRYRASVLGAALEVVSRKNGGTEVRCTFGYTDEATKKEP